MTKLESHLKFPMPGETLCGRTVIASCWFIDDEDREPEALVLLLNEEAPYFKVAEVEFMQDPPRMVADEDYPNIVPAVEAYKEWGGDC